jgi:hypothetical protein
MYHRALLVLLLRILVGCADTVDSAVSLVSRAETFLVLSLDIPALIDGPLSFRSPPIHCDSNVS